MRSIQERSGLLREEWQGKLQLEDYMITKYNETISETPRLDGEGEIDAKRRELFYINMLWFMTTLLDRKDRMSMGASLEVRVPFADHRLVEYLWNVPWDMKMHGNREKGLLRKSLEGLLPEEVLYRKKSPYPKTHNPKYTQLVQGMLDEILRDRSSVLYELFNEDKLKNIIETKGEAIREPWFGQLMTGPQLLAYLIQVHVWFRDYKIQILE